MKATLVFLFIFLAGVAAGLLANGFVSIETDFMKTVVLNGLLLFIGIGVGSDQRALTDLKRISKRTFLIPVLIAAGSILGAGAVALILPLIDVRDGMSVGAGFGFYSLSSVILSDLKGAELGAIALISNLTRELFTILFTPLLVKAFGRIAPIASAAATSMDVCLPVIQKYSGNALTFTAVVNGVVLSILVPVLVPAFV